MASRRKSKRGLYANIQAKRNRIAAGSGETMRKPGSEGAPSADAFRQSEKTAKKRKPRPRGKTATHKRPAAKRQSTARKKSTRSSA